MCAKVLGRMGMEINNIIVGNLGKYHFPLPKRLNSVANRKLFSKFQPQVTLVISVKFIFHLNFRKFCKYIGLLINLSDFYLHWPNFPKAFCPAVHVSTFEARPHKRKSIYPFAGIC